MFLRSSQSLTSTNGHPLSGQKVPQHFTAICSRLPGMLHTTQGTSHALTTGVSGIWHQGSKPVPRVVGLKEKLKQRPATARRPGRATCYTMNSHTEVVLSDLLILLQCP